MSLVRCVCCVAAAMGLAAPLVPCVAIASREAVRAGGGEPPQRLELNGPRVAQRSGGGSTAPARPSITSAPPSPVAPSTSAPPSRLTAPAPQAPAIAPLSPQLPSQFATGGAAGPGNLALSPGSSSEQAPSAPGGGGKTLAACMGFWEKATHMTKAEWREACKRTMQDYPTVR